MTAQEPADRASRPFAQEHGAAPVATLPGPRNLMGTRLRDEDESHDRDCPYRLAPCAECLCKHPEP